MQVNNKDSLNNNNP